jgi:hypothetical protein
LCKQGKPAFKYSKQNLNIQLDFMKKVFFATAAGLCAAIGLASFKTATKIFTHFTYFKVDTSFGAITSFWNKEVKYIGPLPVSNPCLPIHPTKTYACVVGFTAAQLTKIKGATQLKTAVAFGEQQPARTIPYFRTIL